MTYDWTLDLCTFYNCFGHSSSGCAKSKSSRKGNEVLVITPPVDKVGCSKQDNEGGTAQDVWHVVRWKKATLDSASHHLSPLALNVILYDPLVTPISHSSDFPLSSPIPGHSPLLDGNIEDAPDPNHVSPEVNLLGLIAKDSLQKKGS